MPPGDGGRGEAHSEPGFRYGILSDAIHVLEESAAANVSVLALRFASPVILFHFAVL